MSTFINDMLFRISASQQLWIFGFLWMVLRCGRCGQLSPFPALLLFLFLNWRTDGTSMSSSFVLWKKPVKLNYCSFFVKPKFISILNLEKKTREIKTFYFYLGNIITCIRQNWRGWSRTHWRICRRMFGLTKVLRFCTDHDGRWGRDSHLGRVVFGLWGYSRIIFIDHKRSQGFFVG